MSLSVETYALCKKYTNKKFDEAIGLIWQTELVEELPEQGEERVLYFVPYGEGSEPDYYEEYIWIEDKYEKIGSTEIAPVIDPTIENNHILVFP